jgi:drug/metabolite transporter (DMT)-like permease
LDGQHARETPSNPASTSPPSIGRAHRARATGALLVLASAVAFSTKAVFAKVAYRYGIDPIPMLTQRMAFSLPFFALVAALSGRGSRPALSRKDQLKIVVLGVLGYYLASVLDFMGLLYISAGFERLILFVYPTLVVLISAVFLRKPVRRRELWALFLTYAGIALVAYAELGAFGSNVPLGAALVFGCALSYAAYLVGSGELIPRLGSVRFTALAMTVSSLAVFAHFGLSGQTLAGYPREVYGLGLALALVCTVLPVFMLAEGIRRIGSASASILGTVGPVSTIALAHLVLGESISAGQLAGTALVLVGATLVARS